jgi:hypothetical protein
MSSRNFHLKVQIEYNELGIEYNELRNVRVQRITRINELSARNYATCEYSETSLRNANYADKRIEQLRE